MIYENEEIQYCGLRYTGHTNQCTLYVCGDSWGIQIPINRVGEFAEIFPDVNWEDGAYLETLKGRYVRLGVERGFKICSIKHITKNLEFLLN